VRASSCVRKLSTCHPSTKSRVQRTEAGCKVTIGTWLKRATMHWTVRGANAILALRCCRLSCGFEDIVERHAMG